MIATTTIIKIEEAVIATIDPAFKELLGVSVGFGVWDSEVVLDSVSVVVVVDVVADGVVVDSEVVIVETSVVVLVSVDDDVVIEVLLKGYKLNGRVIRPASVKVNNK